MLPEYNPTDHLPPPADLFPSMRIVRYKHRRRIRYRAYLSRALAKKLDLKAGQRIDLLPPNGKHFYWHLDLRTVAKKTLHWYMHTRPRIQHLDFDIDPLGEQKALVLCLVPGDPAVPGYYPLLPDAHFAPKQTPPLAA